MHRVDNAEVEISIVIDKCGLTLRACTRVYVFPATRFTLEDRKVIRRVISVNVNEARHRRIYSYYKTRQLIECRDDSIAGEKRKESRLFGARKSRF